MRDLKLKENKMKNEKLSKKDIYVEIRDLAKKHNLTNIYSDNTFKMKAIRDLHQDINNLKKYLKIMVDIDNNSPYKIGDALKLKSGNFLISILHYDFNYEIKKLTCVNSQGDKIIFTIDEINDLLT